MRKYLLFISVFALSAVVNPACGTNQFFKATDAFAAGSDDHGGEIVSKYDGFNHETVVTLKKMTVTCAKHEILKQTCVSILATLHCPGVQLDYVRQVTLQIVFESKDWFQRHPLDQRELSMVADGETFRLGRMQLTAQHTDVLMSETLQGELPYATFKKMALAEFVEIQVGKSKFELRNKNLAALRDLNNRIKFSRRS